MKLILKCVVILMFKFDSLFRRICGRLLRIYFGIHPKNIGQFGFRQECFLKYVDANTIVVDLACGTGYLLKSISEKIKQGYGFELSSRDLFTCNKLHYADNLHYEKADILKIDYVKLKNELNYHTCILSHILEHLTTPEEFLKQINAKILLISVPSEENWKTQVKKYFGIFYFSDPDHKREYNRNMLLHQLNYAGYESEILEFNQEGEIFCRARKKQ